MQFLTVGGGGARHSKEPLHLVCAPVSDSRPSARQIYSKAQSRNFSHHIQTSTQRQILCGEKKPLPAHVSFNCKSFSHLTRRSCNNNNFHCRVDGARRRSVHCSSLVAPKLCPFSSREDSTSIRNHNIIHSRVAVSTRIISSVETTNIRFLWTKILELEKSSPSSDRAWQVEARN